jgi:7-keto-8-aminopelargonate synthetase-like enzyme
MVTLESGVGNYITLKNRRYSYFAGNNYLGLANHPALTEEAVRALKTYGVNFSASRQTTGTSALHLELEKLLAEFKNSRDAITFATGYLGNMLLFRALENRYSSIIADSMAHPSIIDGIPGNVPNVKFYHHCDTDHLEDQLKKLKKQKALVITDGIFALTGEIAPLDQIYYLAQKYNAILVVDDAHSTGVLGKNGRGTPEHFNLEGADNIFQSETMSKAFGAYGGFISADKEIIHKIRSGSTFYGASTALPPPVVAAGIAAVKRLKEHPELRNRLLENARLVRSGVKEAGFSTAGDNTPIIPVLFSHPESAKSLSEFLEENWIIAPSVDYPVKTDKFIVRITVSANHTEEQMNNLLYVLKKWRDNHNSDGH